jgi:hypothetical protein
MIKEAPDGSIWVVGAELLVRWDRTAAGWVGYSNLPVPVLSAQDGGVWFAARGDTLRLDRGVFHRVQGFQAFRRRNRYNVDAPFQLIPDGEGRIWGRSGAGIACWKAGAVTAIAARPEIPHDISAATLARDGSLYFEGRDAGGFTELAQFDGRRWTKIPLGKLAKSDIVM